jgi:L-cysteine/cystine lyase
MLGDRVVTQRPDPTPLVSWEAARDPAGAAALVERLAGEGITVRAVPGRPWLRASTGAWNSEEDLERLAGGLARA